MSRLGTAALRPTRALTGLVAGGVAAALLWLGIGWETDPDPARVDRDSPPLSVDQETPARRPDTGDAAAGRAAARRAAAAERAAAERAAADKALAAKVLAAQAADERAAAERAAEAKAALAEQTPKAVVAMPSLIGLKLDTAMDVAAGVGLTGLTVCRTPDDDTPLWWSNWQVTGQDVPAGTRVRAGTRICLSAVKP